MLIRVLDVETSSMPDDPDGAGVCEVGFCDVRVDSGEVFVNGPRSIFCNPGKPIKPEARAIHHIRDSEVAFARPAAEVLDSLIADRPDYLAAHKPASPSHALQVLRYWLPVEVPDESAAMPPHRAGPDSYLCALLLVKAIEHGSVSIDDMVRWSNGPALLHRVTFGKHRGSLWKDLPRDYLEWILNKSDMDADTKANARHRLKERGLL